MRVDIYRGPAGEALTYRYTTEEGGLVVRRYWTNACKTCPLKAGCATGKERRIPDGKTNTWSTRCATD